MRKDFNYSKSFFPKKQNRGASPETLNGSDASSNSRFRPNEETVQHLELSNDDVVQCHPSSSSRTTNERIKIAASRKRCISRQECSIRLIEDLKTMRTAVAPHIVVVLATTLILLSAAPQKSLAQDPLTVAKGAMTVLTPFVKGIIAKMRATEEAEMVKVHVWMHNGDPKLNGCGFYFQVEGFAGGFASGFFPKEAVQKCGKDEYEMRMTSQSASYDKSVRLKHNQQAKQIELHADGWHNTFIKIACFGFSERTIAGGPRAFCVNNELLKACRGLTNKWHDINLDWNDIMMTRTNRGMHKMIFRDLENLINAVETLDVNLQDEGAVRRVCDRIDLVRGTFKEEYWDCSAKKSWIQAYGAGNFYSYERRNKIEDKNPYGCDRYTV